MSLVTDNLVLSVPLATLSYWLVQQSLQRIFPEKALRKYKNSDKDTNEYCERGLSFINCLICTLGTAYFHAPMIWKNFSNFGDLLGQPLDLPGALIIVSIYGYMIVDTIWCLRNGYHDIPNFIHHLVTLFYAHTMLYYNNTAVEAMTGLLISEFTNVFLNMAWFSTFLKKSDVFWKMSFVVTFVVVRYSGGAWLSWWLFTVPGPWPIRFTCFMINMINILFGIEIYRNVRNHYSSSNEKLD